MLLAFESVISVTKTKLRLLVKSIKYLGKQINKLNITQQKLIQEKNELRKQIEQVLLAK